jgi:GNAT superfamily N-acetyltransferase
VTIRDAVLADVPEIVAMGQHFIATTAYQGRITGDPAQMAALVTRLIAEEDGIVLVAQGAYGLVGMIGALIYPHPITGERVCAEFFWWVDATARGRLGIQLLARLEAWARAQGAKAILMIAPSAPIARIYQARGYTPLEAVFERRL